MKIKRYGKGISTIGLILVLLFSSAVFMGLKTRIDRIPRKKVPGSSIIYIPSGKYLKYASFGHSSFLADLIYLWAIQYYGDYSIPDRFNYLEHILSIIAELDPRYIDPYQVGALIAIHEAKDLELGLKILDMGLEKNPDQWIFPFEAGHYAQMTVKDYALAQKYYEKTMKIEGAPAITKRLYANAAYKLMDLKTAWETWLEIYNTADDDRIKKIASNHLYRTKATIDTKALSEAIEKFKEKYGRNPAELEQLVRARFLSSIPTDLDGKDYLYDPQTGDVKPATIPWKR